MTLIERLVDQHIMEYESRLKHIDELIERAHQASVELDECHTLESELEPYRKQRTELAEKAVQLRAISLEHWREDMIRSAGPMGVWDVLAQKLEDLVERIE
jgi:hypothetical protein